MALNGISASRANDDHIDDWGSPNTFPHYAIGWAHAGNTPFQWTKQIASHFGGHAMVMVVHWPNGIKAKGEIRSQFTHVTDIAPTIMDAAGLPFLDLSMVLSKYLLAAYHLSFHLMMQKQLTGTPLNILKCSATGEFMIMAG
jgi:hypothetical protein